VRTYAELPDEKEAMRFPEETLKEGKHADSKLSQTAATIHVEAEAA
jgi:hypothetical protein